jgi:hypothetical protein
MGHMHIRFSDISDTDHKAGCRWSIETGGREVARGVEISKAAAEAAANVVAEKLKAKLKRR